MTTTDTYRTLDTPALAEYRDRGSKFLAYAFPIDVSRSWESALEEVREQHPKATHHCYAYRIGPGRDTYRANDDGEPSGSAGRPILGQIDKLKLENVLVVVVRYFGGTKLGVPGLIQAYRESARLVLEQAPVRLGIYRAPVRIILEYAAVPDLMRVGKKMDWEILDQSYHADRQVVDCAIPCHAIETFQRTVYQEVGKLYPDEVDEGQKPENLTFERLEAS